MADTDPAPAVTAEGDLDQALWDGRGIVYTEDGPKITESEDW